MLVGETDRDGTLRTWWWWGLRTPPQQARHQSIENVQALALRPDGWWSDLSSVVPDHPIDALAETFGDPGSVRVRRARGGCFRLPAVVTFRFRLPKKVVDLARSDEDAAYKRRGLTALRILDHHARTSNERDQT